MEEPPPEGEDVIADWYAYRAGRTYYAAEYENGHFSVDGNEWWGEFPDRGRAELYLHVNFSKVEED